MSIAFSPILIAAAAVVIVTLVVAIIWLFGRDKD
jgi:hypothetical protein